MHFAASSIIPRRSGFALRYLVSLLVTMLHCYGVTNHLWAQAPKSRPQAKPSAKKTTGSATGELPEISLDAMLELHVQFEHHVQQEFDSLRETLQRVQSTDDMDRGIGEMNKLPTNMAERIRVKPFRLGRLTDEDRRKNNAWAREAAERVKTMIEDSTEAIMAEVFRIQSLPDMNQAKWNRFDTVRTQTANRMFEALKTEVNRFKAYANGTPVPPPTSLAPAFDTNESPVDMAPGHVTVVRFDKPRSGDVVDMDQALADIDFVDGLLAMIQDVFPVKVVAYNSALNGAESSVTFSPVVDVEALAKKINFATVDKTDATQHEIVLSFNESQAKQVMATADKLLIVKHRRQSEARSRDMINERLESVEDEIETPDDSPTDDAESPNRNTAKSPAKLDPNDPDFYSQVLTRLQSDSPLQWTMVLKKLKTLRPEQCKDESIRRDIANRLNELSLEDHLPDAELVYSTCLKWNADEGMKTLSNLLRTTEDPHHAEALILVLSRTKSAAAAEAIVPHLGNFFTHDKAKLAVLQIGSVAETALADHVQRLPSEAALVAVQLIGEVGTPKSLPFLRKGLSAKHPLARQAAKDAIAAIQKRHPADAAVKKRSPAKEPRP